jgi:hypothetical protein
MYIHHSMSHCDSATVFAVLYFRYCIYRCISTAS